MKMSELINMFESKTVKVGLEWDAPGGKRVVTRKIGDDSYMVSAPGRDPKNTMFQHILTSDDILFDMKNDASRLKSMADKEKSDRNDTARVKDAEDTHGFADSFTPARRRKVIDALLVKVMNKGRIVTRKKLIEDAVSNGSIIGKFRGKKTLKHKDDSFLTDRDITKTAIDYAEYLISIGWR